MRAGCRSIVLTIVVALASAVLTSVSGADTAKTASLSMTSDPYEPLLGGQSRSFDTQNGDAFTSWTGDNNNAVEIDVRAADGEWWTLDFRAPPGQPLTPGTYDGAVRSAFAGDGQPGMDISGNFVGCNTISGSFTVLDATVGPTTYLDSLDISFEQHCDGSAAALRGEIRLVNEPPPPPLLRRW